MEYKYGFERLEVWQDARLFVREILFDFKVVPARRTLHFMFPNSTCSNISRFQYCGRYFEKF